MGGLHTHLKTNKNETNKIKKLIINNLIIKLDKTSKVEIYY